MVGLLTKRGQEPDPSSWVSGDPRRAQGSASAQLSTLIENMPSTFESLIYRSIIRIIDAAMLRIFYIIPSTPSGA